MSKYKAILFDMDGTLLPMDMKTFTEGYFKFLCVKTVSFWNRSGQADRGCLGGRWCHGTE